MEEALRRHSEVAGVVCEAGGWLDLVASRRLQLAAEDSQVLGLLIRRSRRFDDPALSQLSAAMTHWGISALPSSPAVPGAVAERLQVHAVPVPPCEPLQQGVPQDRAPDRNPRSAHVGEQMALDRTIRLKRAEAEQQAVLRRPVASEAHWHRDAAPGGAGQHPAPPAGVLVTAIRVSPARRDRRGPYGSRGRPSAARGSYAGRADIGPRCPGGRRFRPQG